MESINEFVQFLNINSRLDLKAVALTNLLGLTGTTEGIQVLLTIPDLLESLVKLLGDRSEVVSKDAAFSLINISGCERGARSLLNLKLDVVSTSLEFVLDRDSHISDQCCMILSNLSRDVVNVNAVVDSIEGSLGQVVDAFTKTKYNSKGANLHYLGPLLSNLSQNPRIRLHILKHMIQRLLPFTEYKDSIVRRGGVVGTLKNCCFESNHHRRLLSEDVDILPSLLLPLAGNMEYDDEDNEKLPPELQYLSNDKKREDDPDIRCMLLECLTQLCALRDNREYIRGKNAYVILRELHKWETDRRALLACENLVDILIRTEDEIGLDNLKEVEVPDDLKKQFDDAV